MNEEPTDEQRCRVSKCSNSDSTGVTDSGVKDIGSSNIMGAYLLSSAGHCVCVTSHTALVFVDRAFARTICLSLVAGRLAAPLAVGQGGPVGDQASGVWVSHG